MFVLKRLDGLRNWLKGRALFFSSLRDPGPHSKSKAPRPNRGFYVIMEEVFYTILSCAISHIPQPDVSILPEISADQIIFFSSLRWRRFTFFIVIVMFICIFSPALRNFHLSKYLGSYHIDQAYVCLENRVSHWKESVKSKDAIVFHNPLEAHEHTVLAYIGNGVVGLSLNGNKHLRISDGESLYIEIPYEALLTFKVDGHHSQREATVIDLRRGLVHNIHSYSKKKSCVVVEHIIYADQNRHSLLVQEVIINNHAHVPVHVTFNYNGHKWWKKSKLFSENFSASKPHAPIIPLSGATSSINHPKLKDTDLIVAVGTSSIAPEEMVPFESIKSLQFLTAVHTKEVPHVKPTTSAPLVTEKTLRKLVVEELKSGIQQEESLREEHSSAWREIWKSGVTVPVEHHPDTPAGKNVNLTMYYVLSSLTTSVAKQPSKLYPGRCYRGVPTMHTALLWTSPKTELEVNNLALKWKNSLVTKGCESFFQRGTIYLHQAMILSFGGFTFAQGHLEFAANPATLQTDIFFHHIEYNGSFVSVKVLVSRQWSQAAEIKVWAEKQGNLFACEAGCQFHPVVLSSRGMTFPVKITSPVTPLLYISNNETHLMGLKKMDFIQKALKDTHFQSRETHSFLPATFWICVAFLIIVFHLYLVKLIYMECHRENRTGRFAK